MNFLVHDIFIKKPLTPLKDIKTCSFGWLKATLVSQISTMAVTFKPDEGRAWFVLVAAFLGVGIITDGIGVSSSKF